MCNVQLAVTWLNFERCFYTDICWRLSHKVRWGFSPKPHDRHRFAVHFNFFCTIFVVRRGASRGHVTYRLHVSFQSSATRWKMEFGLQVADVGSRCRCNFRQTCSEPLDPAWPLLTSKSPRCLRRRTETASRPLEFLVGTQTSSFKLVLWVLEHFFEAWCLLNSMWAWATHRLCFSFDWANHFLSSYQESTRPPVCWPVRPAC